MGPGNRLGNEASDLNRQAPRQRQWNSAAQTKGELTTDRTRRCRPFPRTANFSVRFLAKAWPLSGSPNYRCGSILLKNSFLAPELSVRQKSTL